MSSSLKAERSNDKEMKNEKRGAKGEREEDHMEFYILYMSYSHLLIFNSVHI